jgi:hypothetical protein
MKGRKPKATVLKLLAGNPGRGHHEGGEGAGSFFPVLQRLDRIAPI